MTTITERRRCITCDRPMVSASRKPTPVPEGHARYGAYGRCQACNMRLIRSGQPRQPGSEQDSERDSERRTVRRLPSDVWPTRP